MASDLTVSCLKGSDILPYINDLAKLRIELFKSYPYLYEGNMDYEKQYLQTYVDCQESVLVVVFDNNKVVGASSAIPLKFETDEFKQPFVEKGYNVDEIFYFGESLLQPAYRGKNIYRQFFNYRERQAKSYGSKIVTFCSVIRSETDSRRTSNFKPLDEIWKHFGYQQSDLCAYFEWQDVGETVPTRKPMIFWLKYL